MTVTETIEDLRSQLVRSVNRLQFDRQGSTPMYPDGSWDIAFIRRRGRVMVLRTGLTTFTSHLDHGPGDEVVWVSFAPSSYMPLMPGQTVLNEGVVLPLVGNDRFRLGSDVIEIPTYDNAESFVSRLERAGIVENNALVASVVSGDNRAMTERTMQRHFLRTTGMTYKAFTQIERARKAMTLLRLGRPAADVAFALGYSDQPHMIRSLKAVLGQTPRQIAQA